jgi:membrane protein DedA with SNARE-associated domain
MFEWILYAIESGGYGGIFLLMVAENIFPPIPSELVLPLAGFAAAKGDLNIVAVIFVGTCGAVAGCLPWYVLGRVFSIERLKRLSARYGRALTLSPHDIDVAQAWFTRHGQKTVLLGRLVPTVRTLISVPAGVAQMPLTAFLLYSFIGSAIWTTGLVFVGYILQSQYDIASGYIDLVAKAIILLIVLVYVYRVITFRIKDEPGQPKRLM